jgi:glycosyltransferase involved in cell wall biosynthesis
MPAKLKIIAVLPAYNAERTLQATLDDIPPNVIDEILLVDDASRDRTVEVARQLGLDPIIHPVNRGYGGNQKTCYSEALKRGADIVLMLHPDHQYHPKYIPAVLQPLVEGRADAVFGSRMLIPGGARRGGMPTWKRLANVMLTWIANRVLGLGLSEYHSGFRAYTRRYLETVNLLANSDDFVFDTEIIVQGKVAGMRFLETPIETAYFPEASQIGLRRSITYGVGILRTLAAYLRWRARLSRDARFHRSGSAAHVLAREA